MTVPREKLFAAHVEAALRATRAEKARVLAVNYSEDITTVWVETRRGKDAYYVRVDEPWPKGTGRPEVVMIDGPFLA